MSGFYPTAVPGVTATAAVRRFTRSSPCPVCGGFDQADRGHGVRCWGFLSTDGRYAHCTREDLAGGVQPDPNGDSYAHFLEGDCRCGVRHGNAPPAPSTNGHAPKIAGLGRVVATYDYRDEGRQLLYQALRYDPKDFRQRRPDGPGRWVWKLDGVRRVLYRLPELHAADPAETVWISPSEKDVDRLASLGLVATCNSEGDGKWRDDFAVFLTGRPVVLLPHNDDSARADAQRIAGSLHGVAASVRVLELEGLPPKGDVSDWLDAGGEIDDLLARAERAPVWEPDENGPLDQVRDAVGVQPQQPAGRQWPDPLAPEALHGLAGEVVRAIEPHTEADRAALLVNFLGAFGSAVGRGPHAVAEADRHGTNLYAVLVGETSKGRKGSSWGHVRELFRLVDPVWTESCVTSGLSSGEGMVWEVRDRIEKEGKDGVVEVVDAGVTDKRRLIIEGEYASTLKVATREGSTLSPLIRLAWDTGDLSILTKNNPARATGAHFSIIGHVTRDELLRYLNDTEAANGFANRYLWVCVKRARVLPEGGGEPDYTGLVQRLAGALATARQLNRLRRDDKARAAWADVYGELSEGKPGLFGSVTGRAEAQVLRLSVLYAALDGTPDIRREHLAAAIAVWEYAEASARYIFGDALGDPVADRILEALRLAPDGMDREAIWQLFGRHGAPARLDQALALLLSTHRAERATDNTTGGRPRQTWRAT